jgi:hypothetical protein
LSAAAAAAAVTAAAAPAPFTLLHLCNYLQFQDDIAIIASNLGYIQQQNGYNFGTATPLTVTSSNGASFSAQGSGIISQTNQVDYFSLNAVTAGDLSISVTVVTNGNVPVEVTVVQSGGTQIGSAINSIAAAGVQSGRGFTNVVRRLPEPARYYLLVTGVGYLDPLDYWSSYGSLGQYSIAVTLTFIPR